jgi:DNA repair photolyase
MDDKVLSFWEPGATGYKERKKCLKYAFNYGFKTSVSMEPMLDIGNIDKIIKDVDPFVNEDIWLGPMGHLKRISKYADDSALKKIEEIAAGQTAESLRPIYERYKDNPKIKFKNTFMKVIGLDRPSKQKTKNSKSKVINFKAKKPKGGLPKRPNPVKEELPQKAVKE